MAASESETKREREEIFNEGIKDRYNRAKDASLEIALGMAQ